MSNHWKEYGKKSASFWAGVIEGIESCVFEMAGKKYVGEKVPLRVALEDVADNQNVELDPLWQGVVQYLQETGNLPDNVDDTIPAVRRIIKFVEDNLLTILHDYDKVLLEENHE